MTNSSIDAPQEVVSFDERVDILAKELELAVKWQRPCILLVVYSSEYVRSDVEAALENYLFDLGQRAVRVQLKDQRTESVLSFLREFKDPASAVFMVHGLRWHLGEEAGAYSTLNLQREFFVERQVRAVFWLTQNEIVSLARFAPDFWAYRHRVIEFVESPKAERLLQEALESEWQGTGEYAGQYEDTDAKIALRESLLTELPEGEEATSLRANLLLTLSILNWRKGDFEKAGEQVAQAFKISARLQDNWFEAECYNALALIKTSTEQTEDAINAYKQAISLAPDQIFAWNNLGNLCAKVGRNDEAMFAFRKAIECNPKDPIAWNGLANLHFRLGYMDDAIAAYRKAVQYMPSLAQPWNGLGDVYASMGRSDEAMKAYHKAIELNKQYVTPWIRLGELYAKQDRYREAAKAYQRAIALDGRNSDAWNELGTVYLKAEALDDAVEAFQKAIELDRGHGWAYSNLAHAYTLQGQYKKTISLLLRSIELFQTEKEKAVSWNRLGTVYRLLNEYHNAIAAYQMADQLDRGSSAARPEEVMDVAAIEAPLSSSEQVAMPTDLPAPRPNALPEPAEDDDRMAKTQPIKAVRSKAEADQSSQQSTLQDAPAWLFHAEVSAPAVADGAKLQPETASATPSEELSAPASTQALPAEANTAAQALAASSSLPDWDAAKWNEEGNARFSRGDLAQAIDAYNRAIQVDSQFGVAYSNLAVSYMSQRHFAEAVLLYQKSIDLLRSEADKAVSWNALGNAYRGLNDYPNAVAAYQKAAELDPDTAGIRDHADDFQTKQAPRDAQDWNNLGELFAKTGSTSEASGAFQKAIELEPANGQAYGNLAQALVSQNKYEEAVPLYRKSIDLLQDDKAKADAWNHLGNVYRKLNDYDNAIKAYQKAVALADEGVDLLTRTRFSLLSNCYVSS